MRQDLSRGEPKRQALAYDGNNVLSKSIAHLGSFVKINRALLRLAALAVRSAFVPVAVS